MRRVATNGRAAALVGVSLAAAIAGYWWIARSTQVASRATAPQVTAESQVTPHDGAQHGPSPAPAAAGSGAVRPRPPANDGTAAAGARGPSRKETRALLQRTLAGKLPARELQPRDYDRLTDAVLRLRAALGVLRAGENADANPATLDEQRQVVASALDEIERITGVPPSNFGEILSADEPTPEPSPVAPGARPTSQ